MGCPIDVVAYAARTLAPEQEAALERHLELCAKCRELAVAQRAVWSALDAWAPMPVSSNFDERLFQCIEMDRQGAWWRRWLPVNWSWRPAVPAAVACAALIAAFLVKSPVLRPAAHAPHQAGPQIEQVEHALDDMEMLGQLGVEKL